MYILTFSLSCLSLGSMVRTSSMSSSGTFCVSVCIRESVSERVSVCVCVCVRECVCVCACVCYVPLCTHCM